MKTFFINEAFDKAINDYLKSRNNVDGVLYNSFLVVVIRMLINIYGELDVINPYKINNEEAFNNNLMKYGLSKDKVDELKRLIDGYYKIERKNLSAIRKETNIYFIEIQKRIIDMFNLKRLNYGLTNSDRKEFFDLLYTPGTSNALRLSYNYLNSDNIYEIAEYYKNSMDVEKIIEHEEKELLSFEVYKNYGVNIAELSQMDSNEINKLNSEIYKSYDISENAINKDYLLEESIKAIKMKNNMITTGNGYVDILLIMSVIITTIMVVVIFGTIIL